MAYAAVISLKHTIHRLKDSINPQITKSVYEKLNSLVIPTLKSLDNEFSRSINRSVVNELEAEIGEAASKLEDVLESYVLYQSFEGIDEVDSLVETMRLSTAGFYWRSRRENDEALNYPLPGEEDDITVLPIHDGFGRNKSMTVGSSDLSENIINQLLDGTSKLKTVSLVGMAGIGKTHVAAEIYHHPLIVQHFDKRVGVRIGPDYDLHRIYVDLVAQIEHKPRDLFKEKELYTLQDLIQNSLRGWRCLILLDDIWSTRFLNSFSWLVPDYENRNRFLLTTRLREVAEDLRSEIHQLPFLNNDESWNLLRHNVFAETSLPSELEKAGRKIAEICEGLPLLILTVANILCGLDITEEYWKKVAEKKTTTFTDAYDQIYKVLLPSYDYLPQHLKACFLYMGVFPQSCEIRNSKLINLWAAEDFLEPSRDEKLEDFAMECLKDLVSNSLAIVCTRSFEGVRKIKSFKLHSTYWYLCITEARKNKFLHVLNKLTDVSRDYVESQRRLSVQNNILLGIKEVYGTMAAATSTTRSLLCTGEVHQYPVQIYLNLMLLKVLDALAIRFYQFPNEVLKLSQLRYLALTHNGELPCSISNLQQLQCLILRRHHNIILLRDSNCLPEEIWDLKELRHLRIIGSNLPDPSEGTKLPKLLTLYMNAHSCTKGVFRSIRHLKKLGIKIELQPAAETLRCFEHIGLLDELESLKCVVVNPRLRSQVLAPSDQLSNLPGSLKKLSLNGLGYSWECMSVIGLLQELKVLKLRCFAFQGPEWETKAGQFVRLEFLLFEDIDLVHWTAKHEKINDKLYKSFQNLRHLVIRHCYKLKKIPWEIGDNIRKLEMMEVDECSPLVVDCAQQMKEQVKSDLQLVINSSWNL